MQLEVVRVYGSTEEWCVTVDGKYIVGFAGPDARDRALEHREELRALLADAGAPVAPDAGLPRRPPAAGG